MTTPWAIILPAAGRSTRFGAGRDKLQAALRGQSVLERTLGAFLRRADVAWIGVALGEGAEEARALIQRLNDPRLTACPGGDCRAASVRGALERVPGQIEWVGMHDAARPMVSQGLIDRVLAAARRHGAAAPAVAVTATIKEAAGPLPAPIQRTLERHRLWAMQTPQIMRRTELLEAYGRCPLPLERVTDDVQLLELAGRAVWLVEGEEGNLKITTAMDLDWARRQVEELG